MSGGLDGSSSGSSKMDSPGGCELVMPVMLWGLLCAVSQAHRVYAT